MKDKTQRRKSLIRSEGRKLYPHAYGVALPCVEMLLRIIKPQPRDQ